MAGHCTNKPVTRKLTSVYLSKLFINLALLQYSHQFKAIKDWLHECHLKLQLNEIAIIFK